MQRVRTPGQAQRFIAVLNFCRRRGQFAHKSLWDSSANGNHKPSSARATGTGTGLPHQRSHSSGFSSGSGSSSGFTPPPVAPPQPAGRSTPLGLGGGEGFSSVTVHRSAAELIEDEMEIEAAAGDILEETELENAPWFQTGMPR